MVLMAALSLSGGIVGHLWPKAHGIGYVVTHVVVRGILIGAVGAVLVVVVAIARGCRAGPQASAIGADGRSCGLGTRRMSGQPGSS